MWETRLLVLRAGAVRLKKPSKIVFVGIDARNAQCLQARAAELFASLVKTDPRYGPASVVPTNPSTRQWRTSPHIYGCRWATLLPAQANRRRGRPAANRSQIRTDRSSRPCRDRVDQGDAPKGGMHCRSLVNLSATASGCETDGGEGAAGGAATCLLSGQLRTSRKLARLPESGIDGHVCSA